MQGDEGPVDGNDEAPSCEPPIGSVVRDDAGHEWRHESDGWWGCFACDPDTPVRWGWSGILDDTRDSSLLIEEHAGPTSGR